MVCHDRNVKALADATLRFLDEHRLGRPRILAAVSGGVDSVALLLTLHDLGIDVTPGQRSRIALGGQPDRVAVDDQVRAVDLDVALDVGGQHGVGDGALDGVAVAAARDAPDDVAADAHGLVAERDGARVGEQQAADRALAVRPALDGQGHAAQADGADAAVGQGALLHGFSSTT